MTEIERRGFLFGALASLAAASAVSPLRAIEIMTQPSEAWRRVAASFDALDEGNFTINLGSCARNRFMWAQLEHGYFPTSYIPADDKIGHRNNDSLCWPDRFNGIDVDLRDQSVHSLITDGGYFSRQSPATVFDEDEQAMIVLPPNTPRFSDKGLLLEGRAENHFHYSDRPQSQRVPLERGKWTFSCFVKGEAPRIEIVAEDGRAFVPKVVGCAN